MLTKSKYKKSEEQNLLLKASLEKLETFVDQLIKDDVRFVLINVIFLLFNIKLKLRTI